MKCLKWIMALALVAGNTWASTKAGSFYVKNGKAIAMQLKASKWKQFPSWIEGHGVGNDILSDSKILEGDFLLTAELRINNQRGSAASFFLGGNHFGFEGASETIFVSGPIFGGLKLMMPAPEVVPRGGWIRFEAERKDGLIYFRVNEKQITSAKSSIGFDNFGFRPWRSTMQVRECVVVGKTKKNQPAQPRGYTIPTIDLADQKHRQVVVDRETGQYLGHPTTVLLEDGKTMLIVYPKGHGKGGIVYKRSVDGGKTWGERLPTPKSWATSREVPTIHRVLDASGKKRLIMWSGLYPARLAVSEDNGGRWSELKKVGDWGGIVVMGCLEELKTGKGNYMAMFHDDGRFFTAKAERKSPVEFNLFKTFSIDGGLTWSKPKSILARSDVHLCEPGIIRSPDGRQLCVLLRENSRRRNSFVIFSDDEGKTWTKPRELPASLTGDRHTGKYTADGRLFISFRDTTHESPTKGDWVAWVGTYEDIVKNAEGQYRVRLMDNTKGADCAYPPVEVLPDDTIVTTTYGHWSKGESPYIVSVRLKLSELDAMVKKQK
ncbi:glycoside hydrolase [Verrucomicrobia bacterium]|nr:glycoside hydrolase [Verrucomicrobiota bacterium]